MRYLTNYEFTFFLDLQCWDDTGDNVLSKVIVVLVSGLELGKLQMWVADDMDSCDVLQLGKSKIR